MPPRFSPREWQVDPRSFGDRRRACSWRAPTTRVECGELLVAVYLHEVCAEVRSVLKARGWTALDLASRTDVRVETVRRKLNGELVARHEDVLTWALVLNHPEVVFAPGDATDLVPPELRDVFAELGFGAQTESGS